MTIKPIHTKTDYKKALQRIEKLMTARPNTAAGDELDILTTLVMAYEEKHYVIENPDPIAAIQHRLEALGLSRKDLEPILGSRSRVSEILNRKRKLTMEMARKLNQAMGIPAQTLIRDYAMNI